MGSRPGPMCGACAAAGVASPGAVGNDNNDRSHYLFPLVPKFRYGAAMRWRHWVGAGLLSTCIVCVRESGESEEVRRCLAAREARFSTTPALCEQAWQETRSESAAFAGAWFALWIHDDAGLERWAQRAQPTLTGARILRLLSDMQRRNGNVAGAAVSLRRALALQIDRDPGRASGTAVSL